MMLNSTILRDRRYYYYEDRIMVERRRRLLNWENNNNKKQIKLFMNFMKIFDTNIDSTKTITTTAAVISNILNNHCHFHNYNCWRRRLFATLLLSILMLTTNLQLINAKSSDHNIKRFDESVLRQQQQQKSSSSSSSSSSCIIGRLRMCNPDEDCVENVVNTPEIKVIISNISNNNKNNENDSSSSGYLSGTSKSVVASLSTSSSSSSYSERPGTCICRHQNQCKRTMDQSSQSSQASSRSDPYPSSSSNSQQDHHRNNKNNISLIATILVSVSIVGSCCAFLIYYYGFRYGMIRHYARQFGLTNNTQIEHQLLNRVSVNGVDDDVELTI